MGWGDSWDKVIPASEKDVAEGNIWEKVPKPFGQVMKEFNADALDKITKSGQENLQVLFEAKSVTIQIPIKGGWQTRTINAIQVGDLAVCFNNEDEEIGLVTHVPTLTRFDNAIPDGEWTQDSLIRWCWRVQQYYLIHWTELRMRDNTNYKELIGSKILVDLQAYCLSVGVE